MVQIHPPLPNDFKGLRIFRAPCFLLSSNNLLTHPAMIHIIPRSKRKVHHEVAAVRRTASLPSTAQFGRSALPFSLTQDESETVPFYPILSNCVSNLYLLAPRLNSLMHLVFFTFVRQKRQATVRPPRRMLPILNLNLTLATVVL